MNEVHLRRSLEGKKIYILGNVSSKVLALWKLNDEQDFFSLPLSRIHFLCRIKKRTRAFVPGVTLNGHSPPAASRHLFICLSRDISQPQKKENERVRERGEKEMNR